MFVSDFFSKVTTSQLQQLKKISLKLSIRLKAVQSSTTTLTKYCKASLIVFYKKNF